MIYKRGKRGIYWFRFRFAGRFVHESARTNSKTLAREAERQRRRELEIKWNRVERRSLPPAFGHAADDWFQNVKPHLAERTEAIYEVALRCHLKPALGSLLLCDIDASRVASYQVRRKTEKASARTLNKELQVLRQILKRHKLWANLQGDVKFEREHNDIGRALTSVEEKKLLEVCGSNALLNAVVTLALNTALRKNEIRTLRWTQIDFDKRTVTVGRAKTEAGSGRVIPLNQPAFDSLVKWAGRLVESSARDYVFPACEAAGIEREHPDRERIDPSRPINSWRTAWRRATHLIECPACGTTQNPGEVCQNESCRADIHAIKSAISGLRFHDLRHTCITKLAESQASEQTLMAIAGHVSRRMIEHYSHIRMEAKRRATDAIVEGGVNQIVHQLPQSGSRVAAKSLN
ncbi:MAG TPA: tyrosine-type recombinase/integrase [Verrucomicrobiae bacterium]|nr:tyrosine-type recombinase/integrase [Verrucomicrobiae bacterium]HUN63800.1 tyrosine-type recombinase/integrase [Candidatus Sulfotelmatobacter sp.]